jgi:exodeoxyribonuclease V alpha subunit
MNKFQPAAYKVLIDNGFFSVLDVEFADFVLRTDESDDEILWLCSALTSRHSRAKNLCLDLDDLPVIPSTGDGALTPVYPDLKTMITVLKKSRSVGNGGALTPMVLDGTRLYLFRYFLCERVIESNIKERAGTFIQPDMELIAHGLELLFPYDGEEINWQKCAALNALTRSLSVITGGPGTGKTSTVVRVVLLWVYEKVKRTGKIPRVALCAPTGKAAAHMYRSVSSDFERIERDEKDNKTVQEMISLFRSTLPESGLTIHRLLRATGNSTFYYGKERKLPCDIVIVDECSMADAVLFSRLLESIESSATVILLGDSNQLSSVESGSVMGDLCGKGGHDSLYSKDYAESVLKYLRIKIPEKSVAAGEKGLHGVVTHLTKSHRFSSESGIGRLSFLINEGRGEDAFAYLTSAQKDNLYFSRIPEIRPGSDPLKNGQFRSMIEQVIGGTEHNSDNYLPRKTPDPENDPEHLLSRLGSFQLLCATRVGHYGSIAMNDLIEDILDGKGLIIAKGPIYHGMPIIITENDHAMRLYNGDSGVICMDKGTLKAFFFDIDSRVRACLPLQISSWEKAYALTIHKSQGSEYDHAAVVLPKDDSPVLTKELLYTAVTRAKKSLHIISSEESFIAACSKSAVRSSGLYDRLWQA